MARTLHDMSEVERAQYSNWQAKLRATTSTQAEKVEAQRQIEALEWRGHSGPLMEEIGDMKNRLATMEELGQSMSPEDRKAIVELRQLAKRLDAEKLSAIEEQVNANAKTAFDIGELVNQHRSDQQQGWSSNAKAINDVKAQVAELQQTINDVEQRCNEKFREVEDSVASVRRNLNDLIAYAISEAKMAIHAEAVAAAAEAVGNLLGDGPSESDDKVDF